MNFFFKVATAHEIQSNRLGFVLPDGKNKTPLYIIQLYCVEYRSSYRLVPLITESLMSADNRFIFESFAYTKGFKSPTARNCTERNVADFSGERRRTERRRHSAVWSPHSYYNNTALVPLCVR
jgi:hypothetical protein